MAVQAGSEHYQQASLAEHVHGAATMSIVAEADQLQIVIASPAVNFLGFEHAPTTEQDTAAINSFKTTVNDAEAMFGFGGATCAAIDVELLMHGMESKSEEGGHHKHHHDEHRRESHASIELEYSFSCSDLSQLKSLEMLFIGLYPRLESLQTQWLLSAGVGQAELGPQHRSLRF